MFLGSRRPPFGLLANFTQCNRHRLHTDGGESREQADLDSSPASGMHAASKGCDSWWGAKRLPWVACENHLLGGNRALCVCRNEGQRSAHGQPSSGHRLPAGHPEAHGSLFSGSLTELPDWVLGEPISMGRLTTVLPSHNKCGHSKSKLS